jgi:hypothetical protein
MLSNAPCDFAMISLHSFPNPWTFDTESTTHITAQFSDFAVFRPIPHRWINALSPYVVGDGTIRLSLSDASGSPVRVIIHHRLYVPDLMTKTSGDIGKLFSSRHAWDANAALDIKLTSIAVQLALLDGTVIPILTHDRLLTLLSKIQTATSRHPPLA